MNENLKKKMVFPGGIEPLGVHPAFIMLYAMLSFILVIKSNKNSSL